VLKSTSTISWLVFAGAALLLSLLLQDLYLRSVLNLIAISALLAVSLRFVMLMGELNFAIAAFVGIGAYAAGYMSTTMEVPFWLAILIAGIGTGIVSAAFGAVTLRAKGPYFLLIGFAFTEAIRVAYSKVPALGGTSGMVGIFPPIAMDPWMPFFVMATVIVLLLIFFILERSDFGRVLFAIREKEEVARSVGINTFIYKIATIAFACFAAGIAGGLHAFVNNVISPGDFSYLMAAFALAYVKVGGEDHFFGPILGAIFLVSLSAYSLGFGGDEHFIYGGAIVLVVLLLPKGAVGAIANMRPKKAHVKGGGHAALEQ